MNIDGPRLGGQKFLVRTVHMHKGKYQQLLFVSKNCVYVLHSKIYVQITCIFSKIFVWSETGWALGRQWDEEALQSKAYR